VTVVEGQFFDPYRPSEVHWFHFELYSFRLGPRRQAKFWFGAPGRGWTYEDYGHVSAMLYPGTSGKGPLEIVKEGVEQVTYTVNDSTYQAHLRLITFRNPTDEWLHFDCRGIRAPVRAGDPGSRPTSPSPPTNERNLVVLRDGQDGRIIAAGERRITQTDLAPCGFVPDEERPGERAVEVPVPEEISGLGLSEICENFVIDVEAEQPTLKRKPE
jgi:hypothetical protein